MDRETAKAEIKGRLKDYVSQITEPDPRAGRNMYKCPLCGSGSGNSRSSNGAFSITPDGEGWKCFSCNEGGDIFNLIGKVEGLASYNDQLTRAAELFNITIVKGYTQKAQATQKERAQEVKKEEPKHIADFSGYIKACKAAVGQTDYFKKRGFTDETIERYSLGYDAYKGVIVIPYSKAGNYYITRSVNGKSFRKPPADQAGEEPIYNKAALYSGQPCFICEAPIDAISIMQAGGCAVALGGTGSYKLVEALKKQKPAATLIISFDNDEPGEAAAAKLAAELKGLNIPFIKAAYSLGAYPDDHKKDANDYLTSKPEQLKADVAENVSRAQRLASAALEEKREEYKAVSGAGRLNDFLNGIKDGANTPYTPTGFAGLDKELDGGLYAGLYVLGAVSSLGKTTLALQIADNIARRGQDVLIFSLEMAANELIAKSLSRLTYTESGKDSSNAKTNRGITTRTRYEHYSPTEKALIAKAIEAYKGYSDHVYIIEGLGNIGAEQIKQAVEEHKKITGNTPIILIDYLQILAPYEVRASDKQNTDKAILELKRLSRDYKTPVIGISSFNRDNYTAAASMTAFKESGAIEYGSDVLIALQPAGMKEASSDKDKAANKQKLDTCKASESRQIEAVILKNRNGKTGGKINLVYSAMFNYFEEGQPGAAGSDTIDL